MQKWLGGLWEKVDGSILTQFSSALLLSQSQQCMMGNLVWRNSHRQRRTCTKASRGGMFCSSALHLFIAIYNQRNPGLPFPLLWVNSWVGQRMEVEERRQGREGRVGIIVKVTRGKSLSKRSWRTWTSSQKNTNTIYNILQVSSVFNTD